MTEKILVVKNISREGPGILGDLLKEKGISCDIAALDRPEPFPSPLQYKALVVLGGPDSANDPTPKMKNQLHKIQEALVQNIPYLGICLGLQTLVKAAGGRVVQSPLKEIGFLDPQGDRFRVELTDAGKKDPLFAHLGNGFPVFQLHGETVELTDNTTVLGTGKFCRNQIVRIGANAYGIQCHFELTPEMFEVWMREDPDLLRLKKEELREKFDELKDGYVQTGRRLFGNFLDIAGF